MNWLWDDSWSAGSLDRKRTVWLHGRFYKSVYCRHKSKTHRAQEPSCWEKCRSRAQGKTQPFICSFPVFMVSMFLVLTELLNRVNGATDCWIPGNRVHHKVREVAPVSVFLSIRLFMSDLGNRYILYL